MKKIRLKSGIRAKTDLDNIIEGAKITPLDSSIFENYVNFITVNITSECGLQTIFNRTTIGKYLMLSITATML